MNEFEFELSELSEVAKKVIYFSVDTPIWLFYGEMGAGKTTLIKEICRILGVTDTVTSPTFSIVNEYLTSDKTTIYHFDFYRLKHESEALDIGVDEYFNSGNICLIEWPEKVPSLIPNPVIDIQIETISNNKRKIFLKKII